MGAPRLDFQDGNSSNMTNMNTTRLNTGSNYSSGLQGLSSLLGITPYLSSLSDNQRIVNNNAAAKQIDLRQQQMNSIPLTNNNNRTTMSSNGQTISVDFGHEMRQRSSGSSNSSLKTSGDSSITSSTRVEFNDSTGRILNPEGQNSPANALRQEDFDIDNRKLQILKKSVPRFSGHSGKHPSTQKPYVYVYDGVCCRLRSCEEHMEIVTMLVYAMMSKIGLVGKHVEGTYWEEVLARLTSNVNTTDNRFHEIISQRLAVILATSTLNKDYVKKWVGMGGCMLQTLKNKLSSLDGR